MLKNKSIIVPKNLVDLPNKSLVTEQAIKTMADAIYKNLIDEGCDSKHIISVSSQLLDLVTLKIVTNDSDSNSGSV